MYEDNDLAGAWEKEGRILFYISQPPELKVELLHTAGVGRIISRVNCNEFVLNIIENHNFVLEELQDISQIRSTIPKKFQYFFDLGLTL